MKNMFYGAALGVMLEAILILADAFDEFVINEDYYLSLILMLVLPVIVFVIYLIHVLKKKPSVKPLLLWHCGFMPIGLIAFFGGLTELYPFEQTKERCDFFCLNGIEYGLFPMFVFGGFLILSALFHIILLVVKKISALKKS